VLTGRCKDLWSWIGTLVPYFRSVRYLEHSEKLQRFVDSAKRNGSIVHPSRLKSHGCWWCARMCLQPYLRRVKRFVPDVGVIVVEAVDWECSRCWG